jgi:hypothetical protein
VQDDFISVALGLSALGVIQHEESGYELRVEVEKRTGSAVCLRCEKEPSKAHKGFLKGKNDGIKVIKRLAYGYRNPDNFRQRIMLANPADAHQGCGGLSHLLM